MLHNKRDVVCAWHVVTIAAGADVDGRWRGNPNPESNHAKTLFKDIIQRHHVKTSVTGINNQYDWMLSVLPGLPPALCYTLSQLCMPFLYNQWTLPCLRVGAWLFSGTCASVVPGDVRRVIHTGFKKIDQGSCCVMCPTCVRIMQGLIWVKVICSDERHVLHVLRGGLCSTGLRLLQAHYAGSREVLQYRCGLLGGSLRNGTLGTLI